MYALRAGLCCGAFILFASAVVADENSHRKAAEEMFDLLQYDKSLDAMIDASVEVAVKQRPEYAQHRTALRKAYGKVYDLKEVRREVVNLVMKEFTEKELKELTDFYGTPLGKKMIAKMPQITKRSYEAGVKMMEAKQDEFRRVLAEEIGKDKN